MYCRNVSGRTAWIGYRTLRLRRRSLLLPISRSARLFPSSVSRTRAGSSISGSRSAISTSSRRRRSIVFPSSSMWRFVRIRTRASGALASGFLIHCSLASIKYLWLLHLYAYICAYKLGIYMRARARTYAHTEFSIFIWKMYVLIYIYICVSFIYIFLFSFLYIYTYI